MRQIAEICNEIVEHLSKLGSPIKSLLHPGLTDSAIAEIEAGLPFCFPNSAVEMYKWRDGTQLVSGASFFPGWIFDSIAESVERYKVMCGPNDELWQEDWFPLFEASDISSIGICCKNTRIEDSAIVCFEYTLGTQVEYENLESMLQTVLVAYHNRAFFMRDDGIIDVDDKAFAEIARKFNPGIQRWHE